MRAHLSRLRFPFPLTPWPRLQAVEDSSPKPKHHDQLRELHNALDAQLERAQHVERAISRVLECDETMRAMHLSACSAPHSLPHPPGTGRQLSGERGSHEALEILLECYLQELAQTIESKPAWLTSPHLNSRLS